MPSLFCSVSFLFSLLNGSQLSARKGALPLVVGSQVPLISFGIKGAPEIAGVVKSKPCGLLHKKTTAEWLGLRSLGGAGMGEAALPCSL